MNDRFDKITPGLPAKLGLVVDALFVFGALWLALQQPIQAMWSPLVPAVLFAWFLAAAILRLYSPCTPRTEFDSLMLGGLGAAGVTIALAAGRFVLGDPFQVEVLVNFSLLVFASTTLSRLVLSRPFWRLHEPRDRVLIVGTGALGAATYERLTGNRQRPVEVIGFLRLPGEPNGVAGCKLPVFGDHTRLLSVLTREPISEVYIAGRLMVHGEVMQELVRTCEDVGAPFALPLHSLAFQRATLLASPARDGYLHYLNARRSPLHFALQRLVDIALAGTALLLLSPLLLGVALAIKLTSRGPVLFRQVRVGLHGATFNFLKFRSMVVNAEELREELLKKKEREGAVYKMKYDPRITAVGRFIRKYSIDELPQLVNILRGDMSIVGPRPALPEEVATYKAWQRRRLSVRPGLTCFWQVHDKSNMSFEQWMRLDLRYVDDWSIGVDFLLIAQTIPVVLGGRTVSNELYVWRSDD
jgi:exopolysaccharide biosynthesis polyprenyl glycosylphosphotransferase